MTDKPIRAGGKTYVYFSCCRGCKGARISEDSLTGAIAAALRSHIGNILNLERILRFIDELPLKQEDVQLKDYQGKVLLVASICKESYVSPLLVLLPFNSSGIMPAMPVWLYSISSSSSHITPT